MRKRLFAWALVFALLWGAMPAALAADVPDATEAAEAPETAETAHDPRTEADPVMIYDVEGLRSMAINPDSYYALGANIDMKGVDWKPFSFRGVLDGRGYSIYNLTTILAGDDSYTAVDGNRKQYETLGVGLFSSLRGAAVRNLNLLNGRVTVTADQNCFCALLSGYIVDSVVENVQVSGSVVFTSYAIMVGVGGICGFGKGDFRNCSADVTLVHRDRLTNMRSEQFTGGILATGFGSFENCTVKIRGYTSCHGYVHDGGLIGMHFRYFDQEAGIHAATGNHTEGFITFFEDNLDRRAYCEAYCGENLFGTLDLRYDQNTHNFERREVSDYSTELLPHSCEAPEYTTAVTEPDCTHFGYTTYTCTACGYQYTDDYTRPEHAEGEWEVTKPATMEESGERVLKCSRCGEILETDELAPHVAGEWEVTVEPDYQTPGRQVRRCVDCGEILEEAELPALVRTERIDLSEREVKLKFKGTAELKATVFPENADDTDCTWSSSDSSVVTVNSEGTVFARSIGDAVIHCNATDGGAEAECIVHVRYTFGQQLIRIFLLGFLWYK